MYLKLITEKHASCPHKSNPMLLNGQSILETLKKSHSTVLGTKKRSNLTYSWQEDLALSCSSSNIPPSFYSWNKFLVSDLLNASYTKNCWEKKPKVVIKAIIKQNNTTQVTNYRYLNNVNLNLLQSSLEIIPSLSNAILSAAARNTRNKFLILT